VVISPEVKRLYNSVIDDRVAEIQRLDMMCMKTRHENQRTSPSKDQLDNAQMMTLKE
jgi:hypothetical protein